MPEPALNDTARALRARLAGTPAIGVIGLGYVGLPLAVAFAESGAHVVGVDVDRGRAVKGSRVLGLGVAYKPNVADTRDSPALEIIELLRARGAEVAYHDPHVPAVSLGGGTLRGLDWSRVDLAARDVVLILTAHAGYDWPAIVAAARLVIDTRNATGSLPASASVIRL